MGRTLRFETPRAFKPLLKPARNKGAFGGRGSAKSHTFAEMLLERCLMQPTRAVCVREHQRTLEESVKRLLEDKIRRYELGRQFRVLNTHIETPDGGVIKFEGMKDHTAESIKSLEGFNIAWVEEAQVLSKRSLDLLRPTIRVPKSELWFTWNPRNADDPVNEYLRGNKARNIPPAPDSIVVEANYRDNPWFSDVLRAEMEWDRQSDPDKYAHVWLGQYDEKSEARVFKNWRIDTVEPPKRTPFYFGADWGFATDPSALIRVWIEGRRLHINREAYGVGVEIDDTPDMFDSLVCGCEPAERQACKHPEHGAAREWVIVADSARPETISYMRRHGYPRIRGAKKGPNSVEEGVKFLQNFEIIVHPSCKHTIDELTTYKYPIDPRTGLIVPILPDKKNHIIDSARYATEEQRRAEARRAVAPPDYQAKVAARGDDDDEDESSVVVDAGGGISESARRNRPAHGIPSGW